MDENAPATVAEKIRRLRRCRDFQRNPVRAVSGRLLWKLRWTLTSRPYRVKLGGDFDILVPRSGSGGFIFTYGYSEPETARFVMRFLKPGMAFWDIGAHLGEYTLLASRGVGDAGRVEAFEPQPGIFEFLNHNTGTNRLRNVTLHAAAIMDHAGEAELSIHPDPSRSHLKSRLQGAGATISVAAISLNEFHQSCGYTPNLIKVDVEGGERLVLRGAGHLLEMSPSVAPAWLIEYDPQNCATFGYHPDELVRTLCAHGYRIFWLNDTGRLEPFASPQPWEFGRNFVATKRELS